MESRCTIGAIASKNASAFSSVSSRMASASGAEVRGPVATMTLRPVRRRQAGDFGAVDLDQRMVVQRLGDGGRKAVAIDRQRAAGGHLVGVGRAHDQRAQPAHFGVQQADRVVGGVVGAERIGADQFGEAIGAVGLGHPCRAHLVQHDAERRHWRPARRLPSRRGRRRSTCTVSDGDLVLSWRRVSAFSGEVHLRRGAFQAQIRQRPQRGGRYPFVRVG